MVPVHGVAPASLQYRSTRFLWRGLPPVVAMLRNAGLLDPARIWRRSKHPRSEPRFLRWRIPPVVDMPRFRGANEPCRKHACAITLGYLTT